MTETLTTEPRSNGIGVPTIAPGTLRRLNYLRAQDDLAQSIAQQTRATMQTAAMTACEDIGVHVPEGARLDIDFMTGVVKVLEAHASTS